MEAVKHTIIIAEAGVNHNGDIGLAKKLVDAAVASGADYVKFQTFKAEKLVTRTAGMAAYQKENLGADDSQFRMLKKLELKDDMHHELKAYCEKAGIGFLSTPFDLESITFLQELGITLGKIPSGEITNLPYLRKMAGAFRQLVMSTGMSELSEVKASLEVLLKAGASKDQITILHCNTQYPTPMGDVNLRAMDTMRRELGVAIGYSDHTTGIEVPIAAVALGATVIEKHFTLDRNMEGPDHRASLEPDELASMVRSIRNIEQALGDPLKTVSDSEKGNLQVARKSIVASKPIRKGEVLSENNLTVKRPGTGINPMDWDRVVGKTAIQDFEEDEIIRI